MSDHWRQQRQTGDRRRTEFVRARIDPDFADRVDLACLKLGEPLSEFIRRALLRRVAEAEGGGGGAPD